MRPSKNAALRIADAERILLILDYDGTLSPIASRPEEASLPPETREVLVQLASFPCLKVCVMSGRSLRDLRERVDVSGLIYIGSHGFESQGIQYDIPGVDLAGIKESMKRFQRAAERTVPRLEGLIIENKVFSVAIHYRLVDEKQVSKIRASLGKLMDQFPESKLTFGKKVFEVRPAVEWNKGTMATAVFKECQASYPDCEILPIYLGDDTTDEDAFEALSEVAITVVVDSGKDSKARYRVRGTEEVLHLLQELEFFLREGTSSDPEKELKTWASLKE